MSLILAKSALACARVLTITSICRRSAKHAAISSSETGSVSPFNLEPFQRGVEALGFGGEFPSVVDGEPAL